VQAHEVRYNIDFSYNYTEVAYSHYSFQVFNKSESCATCTLEDSFVGINRCGSEAANPNDENQIRYMYLPSPF